VPASVIGPVRGPRSASTSLSARVAGRRRTARECVPRVEDELACVSLRRGLAMSRSYRLPFPNRRSQNIGQNRIGRGGRVVVLGRRSPQTILNLNDRASVHRLFSPPN
jgi:hypothetical protein